jgi:hypothetical protein
MDYLDSVTGFFLDYLPAIINNPNDYLILNLNINTLSKQTSLNI